MPEVKRTEQGWPAHFVQADKCLFRRNTLLELKEQKLIVSTVGDMRDGNGEIVPIGSDRYYETMIFGAVLEDVYWVSSGKSPRMLILGRMAITRHELHMFGGNADYVANKMHEGVVDQVAKQMLQMHEILWGTGEGKPMGIMP